VPLEGASRSGSIVAGLVRVARSDRQDHHFLVVILVRLTAAAPSMPPPALVRPQAEYHRLAVIVVLLGVAHRGRADGPPPAGPGNGRRRRRRSTSFSLDTRPPTAEANPLGAPPAPPKGREIKGLGTRSRATGAGSATRGRRSRGVAVLATRSFLVARGCSRLPGPRPGPHFAPAPSRHP
jgi:hypothetical protein